MSASAIQGGHNKPRTLYRLSTLLHNNRKTHFKLLFCDMCMPFFNAVKYKNVKNVKKHVVNKKVETLLRLWFVHCAVEL